MRWWPRRFGSGRADRSGLSVRPAVLAIQHTNSSWFRSDVEGLRAVAVVLVLIYHADQSLLPGGYVGVDVFFVISGFLITGLLLREASTTGTISFARFYGRRVKRLLPAASVVLVAVAGMTIAFLPRIRWADTGWDEVASSLYVVNWRLADTAGDYLAQDYAPSPLQHYWSLAVEEQFYVIWPVLILALIKTVKGGASRSGVIAVGLLTIAVPSFIWSIVLTDADPGRAYFVSTTRAWELALGALVAIYAHRLASLPRPIGAILSWVGLLAVIWSAWNLSSDSLFPGWIAIVPTLGAVAVIVGGSAKSSNGAQALLGRAPFQGVGRMSYSLYLWHWPLLVVSASLLGGLNMGQGLTVVALSAIPAYLTYRYVEAPVRFSAESWARPSSALRLGGVAMATTALVGLLVVLAAWPPPPPLDESAYSIAGVKAEAGAVGSTTGTSGADHAATVTPMGAMALADDSRGDPAGAPVDKVEGFTPTAEQARASVQPLTVRGCHAAADDDDARSCIAGQKDGDVSVALIGDSHAGQWFLPLEQIAKDRGWELHTYTKSACPLADAVVVYQGRAYDSCTNWNRNVLAAVAEDPPDLVIVSSSRYVVDGFRGAASDEQMILGYQRSWQRLQEIGAQVVVLGDTPYPGIDIADCVSQHGNELTRCAVPRSEAITVDGALERAAVAQPGVRYVNLQDAICPTDLCAPVIGGVLVYRDTNHMTGTYSLTLEPRLTKALP